MDYYFKKEVCFDLLIILMRNCMKMCDFIDILIVCLSRSVLPRMKMSDRAGA